MLSAGLALLALVACESNQTRDLKPTADRSATPGPIPKLNAATYAAHGELLERRGDLKRAAEQYRKALELSPGLVTARNRLGVTLNKMGRHMEASHEFRQALVQSPNQAHLWNNLGFSLYMEGNYTEAEPALARALELRPEFRRARMNHGLVLARLGRSEEALAAFSLAGSQADAHYNLAVIQAEQGQYAEAARSLDAALQADPGLDVARDQLHRIARLAAAQEAEAEAAAAEQAALAAELDETPAVASEKTAAVAMDETPVVVLDEPPRAELEDEGEMPAEESMLDVPVALGAPAETTAVAAPASETIDAPESPGESVVASPVAPVEVATDTETTDGWDLVAVPGEPAEQADQMGEFATVADFVPVAAVSLPVERDPAALLGPRLTRLFDHIVASIEAAEANAQRPESVVVVVALERHLWRRFDELLDAVWEDAESAEGCISDVEEYLGVEK